MKIDTLEAFYIEQLKDIYDAERQLKKALPKMAKKASSPELTKAIETHLKETKGQVERLEKIFKTLKASPRGAKCEAMKGLVKESEEAIKKSKDPQVLNSAIIAMSQKVEHYEIASYGTLRHLANLLGYKEHKPLLAATLKEEKGADQLLNKLATTTINVQAASKAPPKQAAKTRTRKTTTTRKRAAGGTAKKTTRKKTTRKTTARKR